MQVWKRVIALVGVVLVVGMVITTFVMGITGSPYTFGMFGLSFLVVIQIFAIMLIMRYIDGRNHSDSEETDKEGSTKH